MQTERGNKADGKAGVGVLEKIREDEKRVWARSCPLVSWRPVRSIREKPSSRLSGQG